MASSDSVVGDLERESEDAVSDRDGEGEQLVDGLGEGLVRDLEARDVHRVLRQEACPRPSE